MNDLDLLKEFRAEFGRGPGEDHLEDSWQKLRDRLGTGDVPVMARARSQARRWSLVAAVAAAVAVAVFAAAALLPSGAGGPRSAAAAVSFTTSDRYIVAVITDPTADAATLRAAFAQHDLDISLQLAPASPSLVGKVVFMDGGAGIETLFDPDAPCTTPGASSCPIGLRIPVDFQGQASIMLGRAAEPGESYVSANDAFAPGEALHCSGLGGMTVQQALPVLAQLAVTAIWRSMDQTVDRVDGIDPSTVADQYVTDAVPAAPGQVYIWVSPDPPMQPEAGTPLADYLARLNRGC